MHKRVVAVVLATLAAVAMVVALGPRADEPGSGRVSSACLRASSGALCARTIELPRWPLASLASAAGTAAQSPFGDADAEPVPFGPHMGALMSMIIQPRHAKLGLAGKAQNWELAAYSLKELRQGFAVVAKAVPRWEGQPIPDLFDSAVSQPITLIDFAIKLRFQKQFDEAYESLTKGCNACHATTGHAFVVIKVPEVSSFPNQEFPPKQ